jgi:hypothetical protein
MSTPPSATARCTTRWPAHAGPTALIDALQVLARGDAHAGDRTAAFDLAELADAAVLDARRRHPGVAFELAASLQARVGGDPEGCGCCSTT